VAGVLGGQLAAADPARKWRVDLSTVLKLRRDVKDAALATFASSKPGRPATLADVAVEERRAISSREFGQLRHGHGLARVGGHPEHRDPACAATLARCQSGDPLCGPRCPVPRRLPATSRWTADDASSLPRRR
jgi:hypothetical protein